MSCTWHIFSILIPAVLCQNCTLQYNKTSELSLYFFHIGSPRLNCSTAFGSFTLSGRLGILGEGPYTVRYFIREANASDLVAIQIMENGTICNKTIWFTDSPNTFIGQMADFGNISRNPSKYFVRYDNPDTEYLKMKSSCKLAYLQSRTFLDYMREQPSVFYVQLCLLTLVLCLVLVCCFNMLVNFCLLGRIKKRDDGFCARMNCFFSILTNRYVFLKHEEDIEMILDYMRSQHKEGKSNGTLYEVVDNELYRL